MMTRAIRSGLAAALAALAGIAYGDVVWDGGGGDNAWTTPANWSADLVPVATDTVVVGSGATVTNATGDFARLDIAPAASVTFSNLPSGFLSGKRLNVAGTLNFPGVFRPNNCVINLSGSLGTNITFLDVRGGSTINFSNGAAFLNPNLDYQQRDTVTNGFTLAGTGFQKLVARALYGPAPWSNVTFNIDVSNYVLANGATVVLVDYVTQEALYTNTFNPTVNISAGGSGHSASLAYDKATAQLLLTFVVPPKTWDGGGADNSWTTAANWNPDSVPVAGDKVVVGSAAAVTNGQNAFSSLMIESGAAVKFAVNTAAGNVITNAGILNFPGVWRLTGAPVVTLTGSGSFGSEMTWLDTQGARVNFQAGAAIANGNMAFELRPGTKVGFTLSPGGFPTLDFGQIWDGGAAWSNVTFYLDLSAYDWSNGTTLVLADFNSHTAPLAGLFNPTVSLVATNGLGGVLSFDTVNSSLLLTIDPPGNDRPVARNQTLSVYANTATNVTLIGSDIEGSNLTFALVAYPTNGALAGTPPNLTYTPTNHPFVLDSFTFTTFDGQDYSDTGTVKVAFIPYTDNELWALYHPVILSDPVNTEWLTNWIDGGISIWQIRYDLGPLSGSRTNAEPKIAAFYAYPVGGTNLPGLVEIHGGGQVASSEAAKYWAQQGYAAISINWGARPLLLGRPNTDWDGLPEGFGPDFGRVGVTNALFHEWHMPDVYSDGATLYDVNHPLNSSWMLNSYAARRALTFLTEQPAINDARLGLVGWSMGGHTTVLGATDPRLTAVSPGVGGTGFLYEDWWGLPGTARPTNGVSDVDMYLRTVDCQSYWPDITNAVHVLQAANDFNAPFDLATRAMALQPTNAPQVLAFAPHMNHFVDDAAQASRVLWMKTYLANAFDFPQRADAELAFGQSNGIPRLRVWPDVSTPNPLVRVDAYYGIMRNSLLRFWRNVPLVQTNGYWEAECPAYDLDEMFVALAVATYDTGGAIPLPAGYSSTSRYISVASEVLTVYPPGLASNGVQETEVKERRIDDFARGMADWWIKSTNPQWWELWTRKLGDPSWIGPAGAALSFEVATAATGNWLGVQLVTETWNATAANTFSAVVPLSTAGVSSVALPASAFTNGSGAVLSTWTNVNQLGFLAGARINTNLPAWWGALPVVSNLQWTGGAYRPGEEFARWMSGFGTRGTNATPGADREGDGNANLFEYGVGGSPVGGDSGLLPTIGHRAASGAQGLDYVYRRRLDAAARGLSYSVQTTTNLPSAAWSTNGTQETGAGSLDASFESVTNRISGGDARHARLEIRLSE